MTDHTDLIRRLALALDVCLPQLDRAAAREMTAEEGKPLRMVTAQRRAEAARKALAEAAALLNLPLGVPE